MCGILGLNLEFDIIYTIFFPKDNMYYYQIIKLI